MYCKHFCVLEIIENIKKIMLSHTEPFTACCVFFVCVHACLCVSRLKLTHWMCRALIFQASLIAEVYIETLPANPISRLWTRERRRERTHSSNRREEENDRERRWKRGRERRAHRSPIWEHGEGDWYKKNSCDKNEYMMKWDSWSFESERTCGWRARTKGRANRKM